MSDANLAAELAHDRAGQVHDVGVIDESRDLYCRGRVLAHGEYDRRILDEYEKAGPGERGALLRREGLYSSHISD